MSGGGAAGVGLMSCVREASLEPPYHPHSHMQANHAPPAQTQTNDHRNGGEGRKGRFLRGLRRMFKRRDRRPTVEDASPDTKSRSTSELLDADHRQRRKEGAYGSGLSVSHDSVFTGERSGDESSDERAAAPTHGFHLASGHRAELVAAVRRRGRGDGSDDDEDDGLPRSPPASPPTDKADKRHHAGISHSSCSDGSLLSVGSSEMDEDSSSGTHHLDHSGRSNTPDLYNTSEPPTGVAPLSHSAARHKMAVRPRRTHGAPRRKKTNPIATSALPITPELNEEMIRSTTPDVTHRSSEVVTESFSSSTTTKQITLVEQQKLVSKDLLRVIDATPNETKIKSSSLPPGLALSQLVGQSPAKLSLAETETPRSSIKRSKSSSQGKSLDVPQQTHISNSESHINTHYYDERTTKKYVSNDKYAEETYTNEKKSKYEKKVENENIRQAPKKEESFFSRLLMRKSGKKKKEQPIDDSYDNKRSKPDKIVSPQYKPIEKEYSSGFTFRDATQVQQSISTDKAYKSAGQRAFSNQIHKRMDNRGTYMHDGMYRETHNVTKGSIIDYGVNDLKIAEETDKMLNMDINKYKLRQEEKFEKIIEKPRRSTSKEVVDDMHNRDSFNLHNQDRNGKRAPLSLQRLVDPYHSKAFIHNEQMTLARENSVLSPKLIIEEESPIPAPKLRPIQHEYTFHSGSMPKNIPYFNANLKMSSSVSPPKTVLHQSAENVKKFNRSLEHISETFKRHSREYAHDSIDSQNRNVYHNSKQDEEIHTNTELKSLVDEYAENRCGIGKSHSFRFPSDTNSLDSQDSQMPSLPAIVGISEPLMESWEINYRRSVSHEAERFNERHDGSKRTSARNYNLFNTAADNYDSLPSTDSSYLDSLKTDTQPEIDRKNLFANSIHINNENTKRNSDISQIEAKIDNIIGSPKPFVPPILKSSSLDSVKSAADKYMDDRRKTISVESALSQGAKPSVVAATRHSVLPKTETENFVSITHLNKDQNIILVKPAEQAKPKGSDEKLPTVVKSGIPEFMKIQLNKVDSKPATNVVLTANVTPKKQEASPLDVEVGQNDPIKIKSDFENSKSKENINFEQSLVQKSAETRQSIVNNKNSPLITRKSFTQPLPPSPTTPKLFIKRKANSVDQPEPRLEKSRTSSLSNDSSTERIYENIGMDQKSYSSFGSKSSIQSSDSNEAKTPEKQEDGVIFRKKPVMVAKERSGKKKDDEPELMKVFARRSLKLKDSEADTLAQEIAEANNMKDEMIDNISATKSKILKNEFNSSIKSRDSDKENEEVASQEDSNRKQNNVENIHKIDLASRMSHFGVPHYQRSVSVTSVSATQNPKRESAPASSPIYNKNEVHKYKKEVSDSTPEKRLRNRTFPDPSNDRDDIKTIGAKNEGLGFKADTMKRPWLAKKELKEDTIQKPFRRETEVKGEAVIEKEVETEKENGQKEKGEDDDTPQYPQVLQMRAEWERRAKQGITK